jgi:hypothetical protein
MRCPVQLYLTFCAVFSQPWLLGFHNNKAYSISYSSLLQSEDSVCCNMACIIYKSPSLSIYTGNLATDGIQV